MACHTGAVKRRRTFSKLSRDLP